MGVPAGSALSQGVGNESKLPSKLVRLIRGLSECVKAGYGAGQNVGNGRFSP